MKKNPILIPALSILLAGFGLNGCNRSDRVEAAREPDSATDRRDVLSLEEKDFIEYASEMHNGEIEMAEQAKDKSGNETIRDYADSVIKFHKDALKDLDEVGDAALSTKASEDTKMHMEFLSKLSGAEFDREFINLMVADHRDAKRTFHEELNVSKNGALNSYLQDASTGLDNALQEAQKLQSGVKTQGTTN